MKKCIALLVFLLALSVVLSACGGGGGGGGSSSTPTGTFTKTVDLSNTTGLNAGIFSTNSFRHYQILLKPADIAGSGNISALSFRLDTASTGATCSNVTMKLGHTAVTDLDVAMASNINQGKGSSVTVLNNATVTIPAGSAEAYFEIPLATPFNYNGVDNLVVDFTRTAACSPGVTVRTGTGTTTYVAYVYSAAIGTPDTATITSTDVFHMKFNFAGGVDTQDYGGAVNNSWPFSTSAPLRTQNLYLASDINGSGPITGIAFQMNATSVAGTYTYSMKFSHATVATLTTTFANNYSGAPTTVASSMTFTVPAGIPAGEWLWVPVPNGTFTYNGTDNLIVEVATTSGAGTAENLRTSSRAGARVYAIGATTPTGMVDDFAYHMKFRFAGGTTDVIGTNDSNASVFGAVGGRQFLLHAAELGTGGSINKLACRSRATTVAISYPNFTITLTHTTQNALVLTDATNIAGGTVVYNNTFDMPAGLLEGDWIEIPFSTPFSYNGIDNLVVQTTTGSAAVQNCQISGAYPTWFADRWKATGGGSPLVGRGTFRFWVSR